MKKVFPIVFAFVFLLSCNKDDEITREVGNQPPVIELDSETGIYITKIGKEVTINPNYLPFIHGNVMAGSSRKNLLWFILSTSLTLIT